MAQRKSPIVQHRKTLEAEAKRLAARISELRVFEHGHYASMLEPSGLTAKDERKLLEKQLAETLKALEAA